MQLIFKIHPAKENGHSAIDIILKDKSKIQKITARDTDQILSTLDKLLKRNRIKIEDLFPQNIKLEIDKRTGLTSQRIVKTIIKALCLNL